MNIKQSIFAAMAAIGVLQAIPADAGEAYVRNTDIYTTSDIKSNVNFSGTEYYNGLRKEFSGAVKYEEFESGGKKKNLEIAGIAASLSLNSDVTNYSGYAAFQGFEQLSSTESTYTHEVSAGNR